MWIVSRSVIQNVDMMQWFVIQNVDSTKLCNTEC